MPERTLFNGQLIKPGLSADRAFHFGDGLFETIAIVGGMPCLWDLHTRRLGIGCQRLGLPEPNFQLLFEEACLLAEGQARAVLKIIVSSGSGGRGYARPANNTGVSRWLQISDWPDAPQYTGDLPLSIEWCEMKLSTQPLLAGIKHLNRLEQVLARQALPVHFHEGLLCDQDGNVTEGIASNLILLLDGVYLTPDLSKSGVAGVVRQLLIERAAHLNVDFQVAPVTREQVERADRVFMTNALLGVRPVAQLGTRKFLNPVLEDQFLADTHAACFTLEGRA